MLISKFDLYKPEWLELVFDNRNKEYGAYQLRQHYARNMVMAMTFTFLGIGLLIGAAIIVRPAHVRVVAPPIVQVIPVTLHTLVQPAAPKRPVELPKPSVPIKTTVFVPFVVKADPLITTPPPVTINIPGAIGPKAVQGPAGGDNAPVVIDNNPGTGSPAPDNTVHSTIGLEAMPTPIGGDAAWAKFLNKNLRYPNEAQQDGVSGRVYMSFIIEKDGALSNIVVERSAGHGFDEEAIRVLKLAKAWKPGVQNGLPVRVKFIIPINFQFTDER